MGFVVFFFFFSSRRRHTRLQGDWSSDVCSSDLLLPESANVVEGKAALSGACSHDIPAQRTRTSYVLREEPELNIEPQKPRELTTQRASFAAAIPARDPRAGSRHTSDDALDGKRHAGPTDVRGVAPTSSTSFGPNRHGIAERATARTPK